MKTKKQTKTKEPLRGEKLFKAAVNQILEHPETWRQDTWHSSCGTQHCLGGWLQVLAGKPINDATVIADAVQSAGITEREAQSLFRTDCTVPEMYHFAENFNRAGFNPAGFDRDGFDRDGFNRAGFDRAGFDRDGFNRAGFNPAGFDRDGFDRDGFNRAGFDRDGFDRDGFNRAGFDRAGFDRDGFNPAGFDRDGFDRDGFNRAGFDRAGKKLAPFDLAKCRNETAK